MGKTMRANLCLLLLACFGYLGTLAYQIPNVQLQPLPNGFRVFIPDEPGVENVAFNINRNRPFKAFEQGEYTAHISQPINNRWSYEVKRALTDDDVLYVWTNVQHNRQVYRNMATAIAAAATQQPGGGSGDGGGDGGGVDSKDRTKEPPINNAPSTGNASCLPSKTILQNRRVCKDELIFEDNFDGHLNSSRWRHEVRLPLEVSDAEFVLYDTNAVVENGLLTITPVLWNDDRPGTNIKQGRLDLGTRCTSIQNRGVECQRQPFGAVVLPPIVSARINTKHSFSFKYGRVEVRAKLPQGDWLFPHEAGIKSVFFIIEINEKCPALVDYVTKARGRNWLTEQTGTQLKNDDHLLIYVLVQHYDDVYMHTENIHYGNLEFRRDNTKEKLSLTESCDMLAATSPNVCHRTETVTPQLTPKCTNELVFEEDFKQPDYANNWVDDIYMPRYDDKRQEFVVYRNSKEDIFVEDGKLHIKPTLTKQTIRAKYEVDLGERCNVHCDPSFCSYKRVEGAVYPPPVYSAKIHSKFSFMYGRIEIRAKLPKGDWLIPYVMLQNVNALRCESLHQAQLRVAFARGNDQRSEAFNRGNILQGGPLLIKLKMNADVEREDLMGRYEYSAHTGNDFHNYTLIWGPESISVSMDGERYGCFRTDPQYFKEQFNIVLAVSAGGLLEFTDRNLSKRNVRLQRQVQLMNKPWGNSDPKALLQFYESFTTGDKISEQWNDDATMKIDYIRVYAI